MQAEGCHFVVGIEHQRAPVGIDDVRGLLPGSHQPTRQRARIPFVFQHDIHGADDVLDVDGLVVGIVVVIVVGVGSPEAEGGVVVVVLQHVVQRALHVVHVHPSAQVGIALSEVELCAIGGVVGIAVVLARRGGGNEDDLGILRLLHQPARRTERVGAKGWRPRKPSLGVEVLVIDGELRMDIQTLARVVVAEDGGQADGHFVAHVQADGRLNGQVGEHLVIIACAMLVAQVQRGERRR